MPNVQTLANGLLQGALFGIVGAAFGLVYRSTRVFHLALGGLLVLAPYAALAAFGGGASWWLASLAALGTAAAAGLAAEELVHWPLTRRSASPEVQFIASLGVYVVLTQLVAVIWGNDTRVLHSGINRAVDLGPFLLTRPQWVGGATAIAVGAGLLVWLRRSHVGLQLRAMADDPTLLSLMGRDVRRLRRIIFALSGALAGFVALVLAWDSGFDPNGGLRLMLVGAVATIAAGGRSLAGIMALGVLLGVIRSEMAFHFSARWEEATTLAILVLILFVRPRGLFSRSVRLEEDR